MVFLGSEDPPKHPQGPPDPPRGPGGPKMAVMHLPQSNVDNWWKKWFLKGSIFWLTFSHGPTLLHLESLYFGFGSPFGPCFMKNRVPTGSLFLDSRYPVLVTVVLPFSLKIWFRSIFWQWIFFWFIQICWFIQYKNLNIDSKTYSFICFSAKIQFKVLFKT